MKRLANTCRHSMASAVFIAPGESYHADRCEPLQAAVQRGEVRLRALARRGYPGRALPPRMLPEVSTLGFWDAVGPQRWGLDWHRNEGLEITYLASGRTAFCVDDKPSSLESGSLTITRPWQRHRLGNPHVGPSRLWWIILDVGVRRPNQKWIWPDWLILSPEDLRRLTKLLSHNEQPVWRANDEIGAAFEKMSAALESPDPLAAQTRLQLQLNELFVALLELLQTKGLKLDARFASNRRTVEFFLAALPQHLEHPWTLERMAEQCGLGATAFGDYCRQITNLPPMQFLTQCRIDAAKSLLHSRPDLKITDISLQCGFDTSQYFATVFRQRTGCSPRDYRNTQA